MLEGLEVSDGELVAGKEAFAMLCEALLVDRAGGTEAALDPVTNLVFFESSTLGCTEDGADDLTLHALCEVDEGVDLPGLDGVLGVVAETDAQHAQDSAGLAHHEAILLPDGHGAEGSLGLEATAELVEGETLVLILEASVAKKGADTLSAATKWEVGKFAWHCLSGKVWLNFYFICLEIRASMMQSEMT